MFHASMYYLRTIAPMTLVMIKRPVKRVLQAKDIAANVMQDLQDTIVEVVRELQLHHIALHHDYIGELPQNGYSLFCDGLRSRTLSAMRCKIKLS